MVDQDHDLHAFQLCLTSQRIITDWKFWASVHGLFSERTPPPPPLSKQMLKYIGKETQINTHTTSSNPVYFPQQKMEHDKIKGENRTELCSCFFFFFIHLTKYATLC